MNLEEIRELIRMMKENDIAELDFESEGERVRLKAVEPAKAHPPMVYVTPHMAGTGISLPHAERHAELAHAAALQPPPSAEGAPAEAPKVEDTGIVIKSPIVGMFYRSPSPDKPPFVEEGDPIDENTVLCIIEAMKVMNEIKAETHGTVRQVLAENGRPVEFGQPMFIIDPGE